MYVSTYGNINQMDLCSGELNLLPHVPFKIRIGDPQLPPFPKYGLSELVSFADAA